MYSGPPYDKKVRAEGKTVIITGASSGIGREAAWEFAKRGAKVWKKKLSKFYFQPQVK